VVENGLVVV